MAPGPEREALAHRVQVQSQRDLAGPVLPRASNGPREIWDRDQGKAAPLEEGVGLGRAPRR
eukprot:9037020-Pyramimonas_sp.AAC.1